MTSSILWLEPLQAFPPVDLAWGEDSPFPGLLAAGGALDAAHLREAYQQGIFPWFSEGQPILWWSPDPRMVLPVNEFRLHRSLRKRIEAFARRSDCEVRIDSSFSRVMQLCAQTPRHGQDGTWIVDDITRAYGEMHAKGLAHSVETWVDGQLVGGLYCVAMGRAVFGESMFALQPDASKIALAALVALCGAQGVELIDCQQATAHLSFMGGREIPRQHFVHSVQHAITQPAMSWRFEPSLWQQLFARCRPPEAAATRSVAP